MKDYLDLAQDFIDTNRNVPDEILERLTFKERQLTAKMLKIKNQLKTEIDHSLPDRTLHIVKQSDSGKRRYRLDLRILYAAAAFLAVLVYFPISEYIETRVLLKEEASRFVNQLFENDEETYILADLGITSDWFTSSIVPDFQ